MVTRTAQESGQSCEQTVWTVLDAGITHCSGAEQRPDTPYSTTLASHRESPKGRLRVAQHVVLALYNNLDQSRQDG